MLAEGHPFRTIVLAECSWAKALLEPNTEKDKHALVVLLLASLADTWLKADVEGLGKGRHHPDGLWGLALRIARECAHCGHGFSVLRWLGRYGKKAEFNGVAASKDYMLNYISERKIANAERFQSEHKCGQNGGVVEVSSNGSILGSARVVPGAVLNIGRAVVQIHVAEMAVIGENAFDSTKQAEAYAHNLCNGMVGAVGTKGGGHSLPWGDGMCFTEDAGAGEVVPCVSYQWEWSCEIETYAALLARATGEERATVAGCLGTSTGEADPRPVAVLGDTTIQDAYCSDEAVATAVKLVAEWEPAAQRERLSRSRPAGLQASEQAVAEGGVSWEDFQRGCFQRWEDAPEGVLRAAVPLWKEYNTEQAAAAGGGGGGGGGASGSSGGGSGGGGASGGSGGGTIDAGPGVGDTISTVWAEGGQDQWFEARCTGIVDVDGVAQHQLLYVVDGSTEDVAFGVSLCNYSLKRRVHLPRLLIHHAPFLLYTHALRRRRRRRWPDRRRRLCGVRRLSTREY
jgi:hypothetical protein